MDVDAGHHSGDAQQYLAAKGDMDRNGASAINRSNLARKDQQKADHDPGPPPMDEVDQIGIIVQRGPDTGSPIDPARNEIVVHQRPAVGDIAGVQASGIGTEQQLNDQYHQHCQTQPGQTRRPIIAACQLAQVEGCPDQTSENEQCREQMHGEPEMANIGTFTETRTDHPPADRTLQTTQSQQCNQSHTIAGRDRTLGRKPEQRQGKGHPDQPSEQPVNPFPEIDELEIGEGHSGRPADFLIFRDLLIFLKFRQPVRFTQWWQGTGDRLPFSDREARLGQTGDTADDDHDENQKGHGIEPVGYRYRTGCCRASRRIHSDRFGHAPLCGMKILR